jgi:serine phosphatase RsbU (regulator of sigma subunit)
MNYLNKLSESALRAIFVFVTFYALATTTYSFINVMFVNRMTTDDCLWVTEYNGKSTEKGFFITDIIPGGEADKSGLRNGDILLAINDKAVKNTQDATLILNSYKDEYINYTILRNEQIIMINLWVYKYFNVLFLIFSLLGFGFLIVAFLVGYSKPKEFASQLFFFLGCSASSGLLIYSGTLAGSFVYFYYNNLIFALIFHPLFIHFFLTYPIKYEFRHRRKFILIAYLLTPLYTLLLMLLRYLSKSNIVNLISSLFIYLLVLYFVLGLTFFILSYKRVKDPVLKKSLRTILIGFLIGFSGFIYFGVFQIIMKKPVFLINTFYLLPVFLVIAIPFSFGISIFKYRILDTEFIIKRGLIFGILTILIVGGYLFLVFIIDSLFSGLIQNRQILTIIIILIVAFTFDIVNNRAKDFVDRFLYKERYNYRKSLLKFSKELTFYSDINEAFAKIIFNIKEIMSVIKVSIWIKDDVYKQLLNEYHLINSKDDNVALNMGEIFSKIFIYIHEPVILNSYFLIEKKFTNEERNFISSTGIVLSVPILIKDMLIGTLNLGQKLSGKAYSDEDIDLLKSITYQIGIALENSRLKKEEIEKQKLERELLIAKNIQSALLPKEHNVIEGMDISCESRPAKYIGGDFCDYIKLNDKEILITVADVSGKGVPAALYMTKVQTLIQFAAKLFMNPKDILIEINKQIYSQLERNSFVTMVIAKFNLETNKVVISRAGHNPVLFNDGQKTISIINKGIGLGLERKGIFETNLDEQEISFKKDDIFLFYSDGLTEAMDKNRNEFGLKSVEKIIDEEKGSASEIIRDKLMLSVDTFRGNYEQNDDITFVVVKITN